MVKNDQLKICQNHLIFLVIIAIAFTSCKFAQTPKAPPRTGASDSIVIPETVVFERTGDRTAINLSFETSEAAQCKLGFYIQSDSAKTPTAWSSCAGRSATKFTETVSGLPKDQLVSIVILSWPATSDEGAAKRLVVTEAPPSTPEGNINLLSVDMGGGRLEVSSISSSDQPSASISTTLSKVSAASCALSQSVGSTFSAARGPVTLISATSRGFINSSATRLNGSVVGGSFQVAQRQSAEWTITARTGSGFGQLRLAKPTLLKSVILAGRDQTTADDDNLEDVDPAALRLTNAQTFVASWTADGDTSKSLVTLTIAPSAGFKGITCTAPASSGKITIPTSLVSQIPSNERLWVALRLDSWQALDDVRWLVRVSDWKSLGVQRL